MNPAWVVSSVFRKNLFSGKAAIVTGGGTGIGRAITQELLYLGSVLLINYVLTDHLIWIGSGYLVGRAPSWSITPSIIIVAFPV